MNLSLEQKEIIKKEENEFPKLFTQFIEKEYGILYYDVENKESHDSNHAIIYPEKITNLSETLIDIACFYEQKGLSSTIYHPFCKNYFKRNQSIFFNHGYRVVIEDSHRISVLSEKSNIKPNNEIHIIKLDGWDERIASDILIPNSECYEVPVTKMTITKNDSHLFVGYKGEKAVVYVLFHVSKSGCTSFDYIVTAKNERGKGYARQISHRVMNYCQEEGLPLCATWFANSTSQRLNYEAGFRPTDLWLESGYATKQI